MSPRAEAILQRIVDVLVGRYLDIAEAIDAWRTRRYPR